MPIWITIILAIINYLPSVIQLIKSILDLIHGLPKNEKAGANDELKKALQAVAKNKDSKPLEDLLARIRARREAKKSE